MYNFWTYNNDPEEVNSPWRCNTKGPTEHGVSIIRQHHYFAFGSKIFTKPSFTFIDIRLVNGTNDFLNLSSYLDRLKPGNIWESAKKYEKRKTSTIALFFFTFTKFARSKTSDLFTFQVEYINDLRSNIINLSFLLHR